MKTDYYSCEKCGGVVDVEMLKQIEEEKPEKQQDEEDFGSTYLYRDIHDFEKIRCPCCKELNQR